jgi:hypothetical protein
MLQQSLYEDYMDTVRVAPHMCYTAVDRCTGMHQLQQGLELAPPPWEVVVATPSL